MDKVTYKDMQKAVLETNEAVGTQQPVINIPKQELMEFLYIVFNKLSDRLPGFVVDVCRALPERTIEEYEQECPVFGKGWDEDVEECVECEETEQCRILTLFCVGVVVEEEVPAAESIVEENTDNQGNVQTMNIMFDILCKNPKMTRDQFRTEMDALGVKYNNTSFELVWRRVRKVTNLLRKYKHLK